MNERGGRALILGDIEGVVGVDDWRGIFAGSDGYRVACRAYAEDVNAVARGFRNGGAQEVLVVDTHASGTNLRQEELVGCRLIADGSVLARIDAGFDVGVEALALVGFHAAAGTADGFVPHSFAVQTRSWLNGNLVGEPAFYALLAGGRGVPTVLLTGDGQTIDQLRPIAPATRAVQTKRSASPWRSTSFDANETRAAIEATATAAFRGRQTITPSVLPEPIELRVEAQTDVAAKLIAGVPGFAPDGGRVVVFLGRWDDVWRAFVTANSLAALAAAAGGSWYHGSIPGSLVERLSAAAGPGADAAVRAFYAAQFSPPWGPACPPDAMP